tara:strand:- start:333 stop:1544 length:1212 start_codon:yes stop_codon:yes gene_type:complete
MANQNLIKGAYMGPQHAGLANYYLNSMNAKNGKQPMNYGMNYPRIPYSAMQNFLNSKVNKYIDNLPPNYEVAKLPPSMRQGVTEYAKDQQIMAGNFNRILKKTKPGSSAYINAKNEIDTIKNNFKNLSSTLDNFSAYKSEFLKDFDAGSISNGADTDKLKLLYSTDNYRYSLMNNNLSFQLEDGSMVEGNNLPKYFLRNGDGGKKLIELNSQSYSAGKQWDDFTRKHYERQVRNIIKEKGREGLLSLATDTFLDEPLITKDSPDSWLLQEENHDQLEQYVINRYTNGMEEAANSGYQSAQTKTKLSEGTTTSTALTTPEYANQYWESGNLNMITNEPGWDPKYEVVNNGDGTFDITYRERSNAPIQVIKKNLDPTNPNHKVYWDDALLGGSQPVSSGIDTNQI